MNEPVLMITIPIPNYVPLQRGKSAVQKMNNSIHVRLLDEDEQLVREVAAKCGMKVSDFIRYCTLASARRLQEVLSNE